LLKKHGGSETTITGCVLVKNEAELLRGCLESLRPFVDELVVADNASTDGSAEVARAFGARLVAVPEGELDRARTAYLEAATGDWILVLDSDERICRVGGETLRRITAEAAPDLAGWNLPCLHYSGRGRWSQGPRFRLWRNDPRIRYSDTPIHASAGPAARAIGRVENASVAIHHLSGLVKAAEPEKSERYLALMEAHVAEHPIFHTYLGLEYALLDRDEEAEAAFARGVAEAGSAWAEYELVARLFLASFLLRQGRNEEARVQTERVVAAGTGFHRWDAARCVAAEVALRAGNRDDALRHCRAVLAALPESPQMCLNAASLLEESAPEEAIRCAREALRLNPYLENPLIYQERRSRQSVHMHVTLLSSVRDVFRHAAVAYRTLGDEAQALEWERRGRAAGIA